MNVETAKYPPMKKTTIAALGVASMLGALATTQGVRAQSYQGMALPAAPGIAQSFSGQLSNVRAPHYDGPVKWADYDGSILAGLLLGSLFGLFGGAVVAEVVDKSTYRGLSAGGALGLIAAGGILGGSVGKNLGDSNTRVVTFSTHVQDIVSASAPHYERHGKSSSGPHYGQVVAIPESPILFSVNPVGAPFIPGQNITAKVFVDKDTRQIVSWTAEAGIRGQ
jgi:hypothetical protein